MKKTKQFTCYNCGVVFVKFGSPVQTDKGMGYLCERCFNPGFVIQEIRNAHAKLQVRPAK